MSWICPDCTTDLQSPKRHDDAWRFCPYTGRPQGVLHITPQRMQRQWDALFADLQRVGPTAKYVALGALMAWSEDVRAVSYLGGSAQAVIRPQFPDDAAERAWNAGRDLGAMLRRTTEWRNHLVDLLTGDRGRFSFDGKPFDPRGRMFGPKSGARGPDPVTIRDRLRKLLPGGNEE